MTYMLILVRSYIHKGRGQLISMLMIIIAAVVLMNIGAGVLLDFGAALDEKIDSLNSPHVAMLIGKEGYSPAYEDFLKSDLHVSKTSAEDVLCLPNCSFAFGSGKLSHSVLIQNADIDREMAPMSVVGESEELNSNSIYAPYILHTAGGYETGDTFVLEYKHTEYSFRIAGFVEDIMFGSINVGVAGFYMPDPLYKRFMAESLAVPAVLLSCRLTDQKYSNEIYDGLSAEYNEDSNFYWCLPVDLVKDIRSISINIASAVMVVFAIIITAVALIVIRFRISDSIQDDIMDFGSLKAAGYTSFQIKASILLQFLGITFTGGVLGTAISFLLTPVISNMYSSQTGLSWNQDFSFPNGAACVTLILLAVVLDVLVSSRKVKNLSPIAAIRGDMMTRSLKKNYFPLDRVKGSLEFLLGAKYMAQNLRQNIMVAIIIAAVTYTSAFGLVFYYNMAVDSDNFIGTIAGEMCSVGVQPRSNLNALKLRDEISGMPEVRKAIIFDDVMLLIEGEEYYACVTGDFDELEGQMLTSGSYPKSQDEVAIGATLSKKFGKSIGDTIRIKKGEKSAEYEICGFIQSGNYMGKILALNDDGVRRMISDYDPSFIYVYLHDGESSADFVGALERRYGSAIETPINLDELIKGQTGTYIAMTLLLAIFVLLITGLIVTLVLYFIIKTTIIRRRRWLGIQKALGFTTFQLIQQIALGFLPVACAGAAIGTIAGYLFINPMLSAMFRGVGIMRFEMVMAYLWLALLCVGIVIFSYTVVIAVSYRIRGISPYALVTE